jgi:hypothetical protein
MELSFPENPAATGVTPGVHVKPALDILDRKRAAA